MSYLCNVFFIVLDLRLTRLVYGGTPFFFALTAAVNAHPQYFDHRIDYGLPLSTNGQNISRRYIQIL